MRTFETAMIGAYEPSPFDPEEVVTVPALGGVGSGVTACIDGHRMIGLTAEDGTAPDAFACVVLGPDAAQRLGEWLVATASTMRGTA